MTPAQIGALREGLGLTQEEMARKVGCSFQTWNRWENGKHRPTGIYLKTLQRLQKRAARESQKPKKRRRKA